MIRMLLVCLVFTLLAACEGCGKKAPPVGPGNPVTAEDVADRLDAAAQVFSNVEDVLSLIEQFGGEKRPPLVGWETCLVEELGHDVLTAAAASARGWAVAPAVQGFTIDYTRCLPDLPPATEDIDSAKIVDSIGKVTSALKLVLTFSNLSEGDPCLSLYVNSAIDVLPKVTGDILAEIDNEGRDGLLPVPTITLASEVCSAGD